MFQSTNMSFEFSLIQVVCFIAPLLLLFLTMKKKNPDAKHKLPPGPMKLPIIGNLHQIGKLPHISLRNLSKKYGDLMFLKLGSIPTVVVSSPDMAREIFKNHDLVFSGRPKVYAAKKFFYNDSSIAFTTTGFYWREIRKLVSWELMTTARVQSFAYIRAGEVAKMMDRIMLHANDKTPVDLNELSFLLANTVVSRVGCGTTSSFNDEQNKKLFSEVQHLLAEFNIADYFPRLAWINRFNGVDVKMERTFQKLDELLNKVIEEHKDPKRVKADHEDIIDILLQTQKDPNQAINLNNEQIKGVLLDIFIAGTDTSAATIIWTMAELLRNPRVKQIAQREIRELSKGLTKIEEKHLPQFTYLKSVIKESWRLHPPAPLLIPKETLQTCTINNKYEIPAKTRVYFNALTIQTDPGHWEEPEKFWPERFLDSQVDFRGQHFELLPFGAGRRGCPGINFANPLVELALATLLYRFDWELPEGVRAEDIDMEEALGITMYKKTPLLVVPSLPHA